MHELTKITGHKDPRMLMRYYHAKAGDLAKNYSRNWLDMHDCASVCYFKKLAT